MKADTKLDYVLLCDDIRREADGKFTLVGVHSGQIPVEQVKWPKNSKPLAIWLVFSSENEKNINGSVRLHCAEHDAVHASFSFSNSNPIVSEKGNLFRVSFRFPNGFYVSHSGKYVFQLKFNGEKKWNDISELNVVDKTSKT